MPTAWWVNQGSTFQQERQGGYVWAPTKTKAGHPVAHHEAVNKLRSGDTIIHYAEGTIRAVGIVRERPRLENRPSELPAEPWAKEGFLARVEYHDLFQPIPLAEVPDRTTDAGPFNRAGAVNQGYLYPLSPSFAASLHRTFRDRWPVDWLPSRPEPRRWLFQANPEYWDLEKEAPRIGVGGEDSWSVSRLGTEMRPGDPVILWKSGPTAGVYAVAEITQPVAMRPRPEWRQRADGDTAPEPSVRVRYLRILDQPLLRADLLDHPVLSQLAVIRAPQGTNFRLTPEEWRAFEDLLNETALTPHPDPLSALAAELYLDVEYLRRIERLLDHKQQVIFYGPPGTGKTYVAKKLAGLFASNGGVVEKVQFHPSYTYEDFVEGYRPRLLEGRPGFALVDGPLKRIAQAAQAGDVTCVLLIDEINRGNVAKVFGELYYLLEYRNERMSLQYSSLNRLRCPKISGSSAR
jgi:hypothetical protein